MGKLTIFRGLPGSGKSTAARSLAEKTGAMLIEPDMFLMRSGNYEYTPARYAHAVEQAHLMLNSMGYLDWRSYSTFYPDVIYADVLPTAKEINDLIRYSGYTDIEIITLPITLEESRQRNIHNVREEDLLAMQESFQTIAYDSEKEEVYVCA